MPDVGLTTYTEPVPKDTKVVIRYSVEVGGLPVYNESYDVEKIAAELEKDRETVARNWVRRITCVVACRHKEGFAACVLRCLADGNCACCGFEDPAPVE